MRPGYDQAHGSTETFQDRSLFLLKKPMAKETERVDVREVIEVMAEGREVVVLFCFRFFMDYYEIMMNDQAVRVATTFDSCVVTMDMIQMTPISCESQSLPIL